MFYVSESWERDQYVKKSLKSESTQNANFEDLQKINWPALGSEKYFRFTKGLLINSQNKLIITFLSRPDFDFKHNER